VLWTRIPAPTGFKQFVGIAVELFRALRALDNHFFAHAPIIFSNWSVYVIPCSTHLSRNAFAKRSSTRKLNLDLPIPYSKEEKNINRLGNDWCMELLELIIWGIFLVFGAFIAIVGIMFIQADQTTIQDHTADGHAFIDCNSVWLSKEYRNILLCYTGSVTPDKNYVVIRVRELGDYNQIVPPTEIEITQVR
jgi:hypothetical protein